MTHESPWSGASFCDQFTGLHKLTLWTRDLHLDALKKARLHGRHVRNAGKFAARDNHLITGIPLKRVGIVARPAPAPLVSAISSWLPQSGSPTLDVNSIDRKERQGHRRLVAASLAATDACKTALSATSGESQRARTVQVCGILDDTIHLSSQSLLSDHMFLVHLCGCPIVLFFFYCESHRD